MVKVGEEVLGRSFTGCENELQSGAAGWADRGLPDPVIGEPHLALTALRGR